MQGWIPATEPPSSGERVEITHADDVFKTTSTGRFINGRWESAIGFMILGGRAMCFQPTHWRRLEQPERYARRNSLKSEAA